MHRDLNPSNIMLDENNLAIVTDFGLAKTSDFESKHELTLTGQVFGTPACISPKEASGKTKKVDIALDIYSIGAIPAPREATQMNLKAILDFVLADYRLPLDGPHGIAHWARVFENGVELAAITDANVEIVSLFAILHDSRRHNESYDPGHGPRAADFARKLQGKFYHLSDNDLQTLTIACHGHTSERTHPDVTVQTCWDSDRLDLARVGISPHPDRLCTDAARSAEILNWANNRAIHGHVPPRVFDEWGICLRQLNVRSNSLLDS